MHILYVHKNFPAQFGHIAEYLIRHKGFRCTFISEREPRPSGGIRQIQYKVAGGATDKTHYCSRTVENFAWHSHAVYETMKAHPEVKPDLVVGHSGFGSTLFLADLYDCPIVNFCEWYYGIEDAKRRFREEFPAHELNPLRTRMRNSMFLADLECCRLAYSPTHWQRSQLPAEYQYKMETIFDGIDTGFWRRQEDARSGSVSVGEREIPQDARIVTYVSRGFESMRGFDLFMQVAKRICDRRGDVVFVCVGSDEPRYGDDLQHTKGKSFKEHVLAQDDYDLDRFIFTGRVPRSELVRIFGLSDLHLYLTVPFILSWSMMDALSCGCTVLASDTEPVREVVHHGRNGLLVPFYDVDGFTTLALEVLDDPQAYRPLGEAGVEMIRRDYSLETVAPKMLDLYQRAVSGPGPAPVSGATCRAGSLGEAVDAALSSIDPHADGLEQLAREHPWPSQRPEVAGCRDHGWLRPAGQKMLAGSLDADTRLVVQTGAWIGLSTRAIARQAPGATVVAVDRWKDPGNGNSAMNWKEAAKVFERFVANCWDVRDRVIPLPASTESGLRRVHACGAAPEVIYVSVEHSSPLETELRIARGLFPQAVLMGDNWVWPRLRKAIAVLVEEDCLELEVMGNTWKVWR